MNNIRNSMKYIPRILLTFLLFGCDQVENILKYKNKPADESDLHVNERIEALQPNYAPMYGRLPKTTDQILNDQLYVERMLKLKGDKRTASKSASRDGWYYFYKEKMDTAMFRFNQAWLLDSLYPESYFGFGAIREYQGLTQQAELFYLLAYKMDKSDTLTKHCLYQIAEIKERQEDTVGVLRAYQRVHSRFPDEGVAMSKLGYFYSQTNMPDSAIKYYDLTISFDSNNVQTYINRGWFYFSSKKHKEAIRDYSKAIEKDNNSISAHANRALVLMNDKEYEKAVSDLKQCILLDPKYPGFHKGLAECYFQLGQKGKACEEINIGIKKGGQFKELLKKYQCK